MTPYITEVEISSRLLFLSKLFVKGGIVFALTRPIYLERIMYMYSMYSQFSIWTRMALLLRHDECSDEISMVVLRHFRPPRAH